MKTPSLLSASARLSILCLLSWTTLCAGSIAQTTSDEDGVLQAEDLYASGASALTSNRYSVAIRHFHAAIEAGLESPEVYYWLGVAHWHREDGPNAVMAYQRALDADSGGESVWSLYAFLNMAEVLTRTDRMAESRRAYERALQRETRSEWIEKIQTQLAELDLATGEFEPDAETVYNDRDEVVGGVGPGMMHTNRPFEIARHTQDPLKEEKYYRQAIDLDPHMFQAYFNLGLALYHQARYAESVEWFLRADSVFRTDTEYNPLGGPKADAHAFLAAAYLEMNDPARAREHIDISRGTDSGYFWSLLFEQRVRIEEGDVEGARLVLEGMREDSPEHVETIYALAWAHRALEHGDRARSLIDTAVALIPAHHPWLSRQAESWSERF
jgi:tetratricopeptide (TPR) repeat protein